MPDTTRTEPPPLLLSVFATFAVGGQQARFATVMNHLGPAWRHAIVAMDGDLSCRERLDPSLDVSFPDVLIGKHDPVGLYRRLRATLLALRPDVMLTHNWGSIEWALANRFPHRLVAHVHAEDGFGPEERQRQLPRRIWVRRLALRRAAVVLPSHNLRTIAERTWRLPPASLRYVPNGIDLTRFASGAATTRPPGWGLDPGGVVVGTVAALRPEKNLARLIRAFAALPVGAARLVIVGDGPDRGALQRLAGELLPPGCFAFTGHTADPSPIYRHMDIFALSSDTEQMPLSLLEAMATRLPVVSTSVGDVAEMVADINRPFVVGLDDQPMSAALASLVGDPALRVRLGKANRERVAGRYGLTGMIETWARVLSDAR